MHITIMKAKAITIGTHAPSKNLIREAEKYKASIVPKNITKQSARRTLLRQHKTITNDIKQVVTSMTVMTAKTDTKQKMGMWIRNEYHLALNMKIGLPRRREQIQ